MIQIDIPNIFIKPYTRMTQRGKFVDPQAQQYLGSKDRLATRIKEQMQLWNAEMYPKGISLKVTLQIWVHTSQGHRADLDNLVKACMDACNGIAFSDDCWVDEIQAVRHIGKKERLFMIITEKAV